MTTTQNEKGRDSGKSATQTTQANVNTGTDRGTCFLDIRRSDSERLRVTVNEHRGRTLVDLRVWFATESGEWKPGRAGISMLLDQVAQVIQSLMLAAQAADPRGMN